MKDMVAPAANIYKAHMNERRFFLDNVTVN